jgi:biopolymer transport protein ExbD
MARKKRFQESPEPGLDMTPMIDIVFNLIIFFMIVSDLSNLTVEQLQLAYASEAKAPPLGTSAKIDKILQVNVMPSGILKVRHTPYSDDPKLNANGQYDSFKEFLKIEVAGYDREPPDPNNPSLQPSKMKINIRADKEVPFKHVQEVFDACQKVGVYKTTLAATKQDPDQH